jgi:hypothetical protein
MVLKYQGPPFPWDQAHIYVCLSGLRSRIELDEVLAIQPEKESPSGLLRSPNPHAVCDSQEPGSHRPPPRLMVRCRVKVDFNVVSRTDRPGGRLAIF